MLKIDAGHVRRARNITATRRERFWHISIITQPYQGIPWSLRGFDPRRDPVPTGKLLLIQEAVCAYNVTPRIVR